MDDPRAKGKGATAKAQHDGTAQRSDRRVYRQVSQSVKSSQSTFFIFYLFFKVLYLYLYGKRHSLIHEFTLRTQYQHQDRCRVPRRGSVSGPFRRTARSVRGIQESPAAEGVGAAAAARSQDGLDGRAHRRGRARFAREVSQVKSRQLLHFFLLLFFVLSSVLERH